MLRISCPKTERIRQWLDEQSKWELTYPEIGQTGSEAGMPDGYYHLNVEQKIGSGRATFQTAVHSLQQWTCFKLNWTRIVFDGVPQVGRQIAVAARVGGLWSVNCCRLIAHDAGQSDTNSWSFTVGTLPRHMAIGEEQISLRFDTETGDVIYRVRSFSRPNWWLARWVTPLVRRQQRRFCRESAAALIRFVRAQDPVGPSVQFPASESVA